jgi:hypothetical protein
MTQLVCSEEKGNTLIIWTNLGFIDLPIQFDEQYWCKSMLPKFEKKFEAIIVTVIDFAHVSRFHTPNNTGLVRKANKNA